MANEEFAILTTTMSDQFNNHTSLLMNGMKNQTAKILEEMKEVNHVLETTNKTQPEQRSLLHLQRPEQFPNRQFNYQMFQL